jgi:para-aminobenzoate synthetase / 4-amino-4-deoxychorismate lyase
LIEERVIQAGEIILKRKDEWLHFAKPTKIVTTTNVDEVQAALYEVEQLVFNNNLYAAGFLSYEAAPAFDKAFHVIPTKDFPLLWFGLYRKPSIFSLPKPVNEFPHLIWKPTVEKEKYNAAIETIKERIAEGRTYQVNYTMRLRAGFNGDAWNFFLHLVQNQNKFAAYVDTGRYIICSASPELFFELDSEDICGRPMKGTVNRGRTTSEDKKQADWLQNSIKNRAENVMIVDMVRNDLGRVAEIGSVKVPELFSIERYPTLFQMTSTVTAKTRASFSEIMSALFPCAFITGAPKVSTMNIIAELDTTPRRIYTGSIGYITPKRKAQFNVAIRTALIDKQQEQIEYGVGGGIVWDSTSADEYSEALLKARVLIERPKKFSLIETMLWTPKEGYYLCDEHILRMEDSAHYFDFEFSREKLENYLDKLALKFSSPKRVRILLNRRGELTEEVKDITDSTSPLFKASLAKRPVDSQKVFLFHKTTRRKIYQDALKAAPGCDDVLLFNEKNELTEFTIGNLVVELNGGLVTPRIECGLLAGTFWSHLLDTNQVSERIIMKDDLAKCQKVYLVNSVRKWVEVEII